MEPKDYIVSKIEGEYAYLHDLSGKCDEDLFIAMALLPPDITVGTKCTARCFSIQLLNETDRLGQDRENQCLGRHYELCLETKFPLARIFAADSRYFLRCADNRRTARFWTIRQTGTQNFSS